MKHKDGNEMALVARQRTRMSVVMVAGQGHIVELGDQSTNVKPPITPKRTIARPYVRPKPRARACTLGAAPVLLGLVGEPPKPV